MPAVEKKTTKRRRGRPPGRSQDKPFMMRVNDEFLQLVDGWREGKPDEPSRAEAIRQLVKLGLTVKGKPK